MVQINSKFKAFRVVEENGRYVGSIKDMEYSPLGENEIRVKVHYSSLNYKDALSASGNKGVTRNYPHTPGIDAVGTIIKSTSSIGVVTCCGNVASPKLDLTVFPFILRGVILIGIDSQNYPMKYRTKVWEMLSDKWKPKQLEDTFCEIELDELQHKIELMLQGKLKGRTVLNLIK